MRTGLKLLAVVALLAFAPLQTANANLIVATFGGTLNVGYADNPFGLSVGDQFIGSFAYDSVTGTPSYFAATAGGLNFVANNLSTYVNLFDGIATAFTITGELSNGSYMALGLLQGFPVFTTDPPPNLSADDWFQRQFRITPDRETPLDCCIGPRGIGAAYQSMGPLPRSDFFLTTFSVPEPATLPLAALGLAGVGFMIRRKAS